MGDRALGGSPVELLFWGPFCGTTASGAGAFFPEGVTGGFDLQVNPAGTESVILCDDRFSDIEAVIVKFDDLPAVDTDEVSMPGVIRKVGVVQGRGLSEIDLTKKACTYKKGEGAINGGAGDLRIAATGTGEKGFGAKVLAIAKGDFGDCFSLGGKTKTLGAHRLIRTGLWGQGRSRGVGHTGERTMGSEREAVPDSRGVLSALRKRFTAGEIIRLDRETIPSGRMISGP